MSAQASCAPAVFPAGHPDCWTSEQADAFADLLGDIRLPTTYGFADNGQAMDTLSLYEPELVNTRMHWDVVRHAPLAQHPIPAQVYSAQDYVNEVVVEYYVRNGQSLEQTGGNSCISLVEYQGKVYVFNGTHRLAALMRTGASHYTGRYVLI